MSIPNVIRQPTYLFFCAASVAFTFMIWSVSLGQSLNEIERSGRTDLRLASDRLVSQLQRYRELLVVLATDPRLQNETSRETLEAILLRAADLSGSLDILLIDANRNVLASAKTSEQGPWVEEAFVDRALTGALGNYHAVSDVFQTRAFYFSAPIFSDQGPVVAALVAIVDMDRIEAEGRGATPAVLFTDRLGVTFTSNRSELVLMQRGTGTRDATARYDRGELRPFVRFESGQLKGREVWTVDAGPYVPSRALYLKHELPLLDMTAEALIDVRPAYANAGLQATVAAALLTVFGVILFLTAERRQALARANATLEARVNVRTRELQDSNVALRSEIYERKEAEQALKRAQDELVQVGKLSALGHMSAGISHELNQPLMAIRSFAENATQFLDMGKEHQARQNLEKVSDLAVRMARIIRNLKSFARNEKEPATRVDLCRVVRAALDVSEARLANEGFGHDIRLPNRPVWVLGGEVRLQQVVVNLISNAMDAMAASDEKSLFIEVIGGKEPAVQVRDTGPGITDPDRIFEPFYSTKSVGDGDGTGLGLSISYGLVQSFGGNISGENLPEGGALFTVRLQPVHED